MSNRDPNPERGTKPELRKPDKEDSTSDTSMSEKMSRLFSPPKRSVHAGRLARSPNRAAASQQGAHAALDDIHNEESAEELAGILQEDADPAAHSITLDDLDFGRVEVHRPRDRRVLRQFRDESLFANDPENAHVYGAAYDVVEAVLKRTAEARGLGTDDIDLILTQLLAVHRARFGMPKTPAPTLEPLSSFAIPHAELPSRVSEQNVAETAPSSYTQLVNKEVSLSDLLNSLSEFLKQNPDQWPAAHDGVSSLLTPFSSINSAASKDAASRPTSPARANPLPTEPPERWADRDLNRRENAVQFLRRVYAPWIGKGLTRRDIRGLDRDLYRAMAVWLHRHPEESLEDFPDERARIDKIYERLSSELSIDDLRKLGYAIDARTRKLTQ